MNSQSISVCMISYYITLVLNLFGKLFHY